MWPTNLNLHFGLDRYPGQAHHAPIAHSSSTTRIQDPEQVGMVPALRPSTMPHTWNDVPSHTTMQHVDPFKPFSISSLPRHLTSASAETRRDPVLMASFAFLIAIFAAVFSLACLHLTIIPFYRHVASRRFSFDSNEDAERALERARVKGPFKFNGLEYYGYVEPELMPTPPRPSDSKSEPEREPSPNVEAAEGSELLRFTDMNIYYNTIDYPSEDCDCMVCLQCRRHDGDYTAA